MDNNKKKFYLTKMLSHTSGSAGTTTTKFTQHSAQNLERPVNKESPAKDGSGEEEVTLRIVKTEDG